MIIDKNNMHDVDTFMFFKYFFKACVAVLIVSNTFNLIMAVFDVGQHIVSNSAGVIAGNTNINISSALTNLRPTLEAMGTGELFLLMLETALVSLCSGVYGLHENTIISAALKERKKVNNIMLGKIHRIWRKIFPTYRGMKTKYQILKKYPILLPLFWIIRLIDVTFSKRKDISKNLNDICVVNEQQIQEYETALNYVGLDYNF
ncbi:MAG: hypothetical protein E7398_06380 [Ruminococcaceae bacterium]|nr:hypothetical protein [Oscillospiraceae bacterium]